MKKPICLLLILLVSFQVFSQKKFPKSEYRKMIEQHAFGSIFERYTLVLTAYFDDFCEFGEHDETIELIRIDKKLSAIARIYDKSCQDTNYAKPKIIKTDTYLVQESKAENSQEYLNLLMKKSLEFYVPFALKTALLTQKEIVRDEALPPHIYNFYNLDPIWGEEIVANRILLLEPTHFEQYPITQNSIDFMLQFSEENISNIQIYIVDFEAFNKVNTSTAIYYKEHPLNNDDQGIEEARDWVFDEKGYYSSFFSFWKKCKKELEC
ncbi:MAG: hypothetical protein ACI863_000258 [Flavobacteriales bacterium]|jgi:hypothetical protein